MSRTNLTSNPGPLSERGLQAITERLIDNKPVRRTVRSWGRLHIDRQLPFLCVHRHPPGSTDETTGRLITSQAAYALAPGDTAHHRHLTQLVKSVAEVMVERFGAFLVVEVWVADPATEEPADAPPRPEFDVVEPPASQYSSTAETLHEALARIKISRQSALVNVSLSRRVAPPGLRPLFSDREAQESACYLLGIGIKPIYLNPETGAPYPLRVRAVKRQLARALAQVFYAFAVEHTTHQPPHYHALARHAMVKAVWEVDRRLAAVSNSFDLLLQVTPINGAAAAHEFHRRRFTKPPTFLYRPRPVDPSRMKRTLHDIPIDRIEDPTLMHLFLEKQIELDRQLTMLQDLGQPPFVYGSLQLYGAVNPSLVQVAREILGRVSPRSRANGKDGHLTPVEFRKRALKEFDWYQRQLSDFKASVEIRDDMYAGLMCSRGRLLIGRDTRIPLRRAEALLQHEVGTHLLTYFNAVAQPFRMLSTGLPGYSELQEGLAVLAEYLVGELSPARLRILAARVVAAHSLTDGATFIETYRLLTQTYHFTQATAFTITMRVFRGGGFVKDAIYLRGLIRLLDYLARHGGFERLLVGKFALSHVPVIEELIWRNILKPAPLQPRYLEQPQARDRLRRVQQGLKITQLLEK